MRDETTFRTALSDGDRRTAAAWLVRTYAKDVLSLCRSMVGTSQAEDLTQDAFHKALSALGEFRAEASARTWLLTIARHRCVDHLRRQARRPDAQADEGDDTADDSPLTSDLLADKTSVARALESLDESSRALVVLRFHHGLGYPELAEAYGLKQGAVRMRISRALATMRAALTAPRSASAALERAYQQGKPTAVPPPPSRARRAAPGGAPPPASAPMPMSPAMAPAPAPDFGSLLGDLQPAVPGALAAKLDALVGAL